MKYGMIGLLFVLSACAVQPHQAEFVSAPTKPVDKFDTWLNSEIQRDKMFEFKQHVKQNVSQ